MGELIIKRSPYGQYCVFEHEGRHYLASSYSVCLHTETVIYAYNKEMAKIDINAGEKYIDKTGKPSEDCVIEFKLNETNKRNR